MLPSASVFYGLTVSSGEAAAFYIKLYWEGTGTAPPTVPGGPQPATTLPTAGTTVPHVTIQVPTTGVPPSSFVEPLNNGGRIWYWISSLKADSDTTALPTGGDVVTFVYD